uniref:Uncharacterized protein n=1 Tax=Romanomermis culicivorax TaxID=13658 RepID=A0A915JS82_ROMCU
MSLLTFSSLLFNLILISKLVVSKNLNENRFCRYNPNDPSCVTGNGKNFFYPSDFRRPFPSGSGLRFQQGPINRLVFSNNQLEYVVHSLGKKLYRIEIFTPKRNSSSYANDQFYLRIRDFCDDNLGKYFQYCFDGITRFRLLLPDKSDQMRNDEYFCAKFRWRCDRDRQIIQGTDGRPLFKILAPTFPVSNDQGSRIYESPAKAVIERSKRFRSYPNLIFCVKNSAQYHAQCATLLDNKPFCRNFYILCHTLSNWWRNRFGSEKLPRENEQNLAAKSLKSKVSINGQNLRDVMNFFDQLD